MALVPLKSKWSKKQMRVFRSLSLKKGHFHLWDQYYTDFFPAIKGLKKFNRQKDFFSFSFIVVDIAGLLGFWWFFCKSNLIGWPDADCKSFFRFGQFCFSFAFWLEGNLVEGPNQRWNVYGLSSIKYFERIW